MWIRDEFSNIVTPPCVAITVIIFVASVISRLAVEIHEPPVVTKCRELIAKSVNTVEMATKEKDPLLKYQHYTTALAFLCASREFTTDAELERATGIDIAGLWAQLQGSMIATRNGLRKKDSG
jgi:hypothetical protein